MSAPRHERTGASTREGTGTSAGARWLASDEGLAGVALKGQHTHREQSAEQSVHSSPSSSSQAACASDAKATT